MKIVLSFIYYIQFVFIYSFQRNMSKKKLTTKNLQNITEAASVAEVSNHHKNNGQKLQSNELSQNLTSSNNTTVLKGLIGAEEQRQSKTSEPFGSVLAGQDERPTVTRNFQTNMAKGAKINAGAGEVTGRNLDHSLNSKDSGRYTGFKSYDTTKMPIGTDKDELKDTQELQSMDYAEQILKVNDMSLDGNSQINLGLPLPRVRVLSDAEADAAEEEKSEENTGDRQTGEGHSMSKSKIHDQTQQDLTKDASILTKMRILENSSAGNSAIMSPAGYQHQSAMNSYNASRSPSPNFNQIGSSTKTPVVVTQNPRLASENNGRGGPTNPFNKINQVNVEQEDEVGVKALHMKMASEKNGTKMPDLKAIINKFKKQNSGVHVRKANFRVQNENPESRNPGADADSAKQKSNQTVKTVQSTPNRLVAEQHESQIENEKLQMNGMTLKQFNAVTKTINLLNRAKSLRQQKLNREHGQDGPAGELELQMNAEEEEYLAIDIKGLVDDDIAERRAADATLAKVETMIVERIKMTEPLMLRYDSTWKLRWDFFIILLALWNSISIPLEVAFPEMPFFTKTTYIVFGRIVDILFAVDLIVNMRVTFIHPQTGVEIVDGRQIARNYIFGGRFVVDLMASVPFDLLIPDGGGEDGKSTQTAQLLGLLKLVRLLRLGRLVTFMKMNQNLKTGFKIFQMLLILLLIVHFTACLIYTLVGETHSWLPPKDLNNQRTTFYSETPGRKYPIMFYYGLMLIVGNEMAPKSNVQTLFFTILILIGSLIMAFIFGSIAAAMSSMGKQQNRFQDIGEIVQNTMIQIKLPEEFQEKIHDYLINVEESQDVNLDFNMFVKLLSPYLKHQVQTFVLQRIIQSNIYMSSAQPLAVNFIVQNLKNEILLPNDEIISQGTLGDQMYFIIKGRLSVFIEKKVDIYAIRAIPGLELFVPFSLQQIVNQHKRKSMASGSNLLPGNLTASPGKPKKKPKLAQVKSGIRRQSIVNLMYGTNIVLEESSSPLNTPKQRSDSAPKAQDGSGSASKQSSIDAFGGEPEVKTSNEEDSALNVSSKRRASDIITKTIPSYAKRFSLLLAPLPASTEKEKITATPPECAQPLSRSAEAKKYAKTDLIAFHTEGSDEEEDLDPYDYGLTLGTTALDFEQMHYVDKKIRTLKDGEHFGEIALLTKMKRTASVRANEYCTISSMSKHSLLELGEIFPDLLLQFRNGVKQQYMDLDFRFRKLMIMNVPYFVRLSTNIIVELSFLMRSQKYDAGASIVHRGDNVKRLFFINEGIVDVQVPFLDTDLHFDFLNPGSNFCIFTCFNNESLSVVNFVAKTQCIISHIDVADIMQLAKKFIDLKDTIKKIVIEVNKGSKTDFDFFRFCERRYKNAAERALDRLFEKKQSKLSKRKIRKALRRFFYQYQHGEAQMPLALEAMQYLQRQKAEKQVFQWMNNKEQEHIIQFIKRIGAHNIKNGRKESMDQDYQYLMEQIHRGENFQMLTIEDLENLELDFLAENVMSTDESEEMRDKLQKTRATVDYENQGRKIQDPAALEDKITLLKSQQKQTEAAQYMIQKEIDGHPYASVQQAQHNVACLREAQSLIDELLVQIAILESQLSIAKIRGMQEAVLEVNANVDEQMAKLFQIRRKSKMDKDYTTGKMQTLLSQINTVTKEIRRQSILEHDSEQDSDYKSQLKCKNNMDIVENTGSVLDESEHSSGD